MVFCPIAGSSAPTFCSRCSRCCQMAWRQADTPRPHPGSQLTSLSCDHLGSPLREVSGRSCSYERTLMQTHGATSDLYTVVEETRRALDTTDLFHVASHNAARRHSTWPALECRTDWLTAEQLCGQGNISHYSQSRIHPITAQEFMRMCRRCCGLSLRRCTFVNDSSKRWSRFV